jgi:hypothetical protein
MQSEAGSYVDLLENLALPKALGDLLKRFHLAHDGTGTARRWLSTKLTLLIDNRTMCIPETQIPRSVVLKDWASHGEPHVNGQAGGRANREPKRAAGT